MSLSSFLIHIQWHLKYIITKVDSDKGVINLCRFIMKMQAHNFYPSTIRINSDNSDIVKREIAIGINYLYYTLYSGSFRFLRSLAINNFKVNSKEMIGFFSLLSKSPIIHQLGLLYMNLEEIPLLTFAIAASQNSSLVYW